MACSPLSFGVSSVKVTECRVHLPPVPSNTRYLGRASVALNDVLVIHDIRIIRGDDGLFIVMPNRPLAQRCEQCNHQVPVLDNYCGRCGAEQPDGRATPVKSENWIDFVHPINAEGRRWLTGIVLAAYREAVAKPEKPQEVFGHCLDLEEP